jgi:hypothetical protein
MGAGVFHGRVRDGNGCCNPAMATRPPQPGRAEVGGWGLVCVPRRSRVRVVFAGRGPMVLRAVAE